MSLQLDIQGQTWKNTLTAWAEHLRHPAWGITHCQRVYTCSKWLLRESSGYDDEALFAASVIHDLGALEPYAKPGIDHSVGSAELAQSILEPMGFDMSVLPLVQEIILHHMHSNQPGKSRESIAFRDSNTLDLLGAIGISRMLSVVGKHAMASDLSGAIATLQRLRRDLPETLTLPEAQKEGHTRCREMDYFFTALSQQTYGMTRL